MSALATQWRILKALMIRDMIVRYGRDNIGFVWVILEPMILCVGVMAIWSAMKQPYEHGVQVATFVITGYMPLTLFRHLTSCNVRLLWRSLPMLVHRPLSLIDIFLARSILEFVGTTVALCVVYGVLAVFGVAEPISNFNKVVGGWLLLGWLSLGIGACIAAVTELTETAERFVAPIQYLTVPLSPTFYMIDWLPSAAQRLMYYNPLAHCYEMIRDGVFGPTVNTYYDPIVPLLTGLVYFSIGIYGIEAVKEKLHSH
jgi:capsular polysaccharide transport system permease protein